MNAKKGTRDQTCLPTLIRTNAERSSLDVGQIGDQQWSVRPDTLLTKDGIHFALSERRERRSRWYQQKGDPGAEAVYTKVLRDLFTHALREGGQQEALARAEGSCMDTKW